MAYEQLKLNNQVCFRLYSAARLIVRSYQPFLSRIGITYTQYLVLMVLWEKDRQTVSAIGDRLLLETNTVTPLIKRMESEGLLTRARGQEDGRQRIVALTPKGRELEKEAAEIPGCLMGTLHDCELSDGTLVSVVPYLDEIIAKLSAAPSGS